MKKLLSLLLALAMMLTLCLTAAAETEAAETPAEETTEAAPEDTSAPAADASSDTNFVEYTDETSGYAISVPDTWTKKDIMNGMLNFVAPDNASSLNVVAASLGATMTTEELVAMSSQLVAQYQAIFSDYALATDAQAYSCGDVEYAMLAGTYTLNGVSYYMITLMTCSGTATLYTITIAMPMTDANAVMQISNEAEAAAGTFRLLD